MLKAIIKVRYILGILFLIVLIIFLIRPPDVDEIEPTPVNASVGEITRDSATIPPLSSTQVLSASFQNEPTEAVNNCLVASPDLLFLVSEDGSLMRINLDDPQDKTSLAVISTATDFSPYDLSPTENLIAFSSGENDRQDIILIDFEGHILQRLTEDAAEDTAPRFSPQGDAIAFTKFRDESYDVNVVDLNGQITKHFDVNACRPEIAWLDEEHLIVIACNDQPGLWSLNLATGQMSPLTNTPGEKRAPDASPNGEMVSFLCKDVSDSSFDLCLLETETGVIQQLAQKLDQQSTPAWSTLGDGFVFTTSEGIVHYIADGDESIVLYSPETQNSNQNLWHPRLANDTCKNTSNSNSTPSPNSSYQTMKANECTACHVTVSQTHMERLDQICQECHLDVDQLHAGVEDGPP